MTAPRRAWVPWARAGVLALAVTVLCWPAGSASSLVAALGALAAALSAERLALGSYLGGRLRLPTVWIGALTVAFAGLAVARLAANSAGFAAFLGPSGAIHASEALLWLSATAPVVFALRFTARRYPVAGVVEAALVAGCFVSALAAHRNGLVTRPFLLGDWSFELGVDPTVVLVALGGLATLLISALLVAEDRAGRTGVHLSVLAIVALALIGVVRLDVLPTPDPPGTGKAEEKEERESESGSAKGAAGQSRSTPRDDWDFRDDFDSDRNEAPVAVVVLHDDYEPNSGAYYFRQSALSQFNGRRLVQATRDDVDRDVLGYFPTEQVRLPEQPGEGEGRRPLRTTTGLLVDHVRPFALDSPVFFEPSDRGSRRFQRTYAALSLVQTVAYESLLGGSAGRDDWGPAQWAHYTAAPADPRYRELAREIEKGLPEHLRDDPLARAVAVKLYLDENGVYNLSSRHADSEDPTASFLFGDLTGYCVHFAHAASFLLRSLGVPSRVATGYAVPARESYGGSAILIRSLNAHAWPEIHVSGLGWVVVDPVPERSEVAVAPPNDPELQRLLGELLREKAGEQSVADRLADGGGRLAAIGRALLAALLAAVACGYAVRTHRRLAPRFATASQCHRVAYRAALDRLAGVGWRRRFGESREHFARRVFRVAPSLAPLTGLHLRASLGDVAPDDPLPLRELAWRVASELREGVPLWRRVLAALDPFAWMRVH
ncbi:MAG: transglutaminase-like domain-containing protein [Myxococcota bacterium]|nr:transglutaminase-like domain-containing protein [Myxococcota bacterium]